MICSFLLDMGTGPIHAQSAAAAKGSIWEIMVHRWLPGYPQAAMRHAERGQTICKPGSVPARADRRWPFIWDARCRTPHATNPGGGRKPPWAAWTRPPLFGLAPGGVYPATPVAGGAVRSCRTLSPLPSRNRAVCFLWHCPWGRPRRALPGTVFPWSPDFPPPPRAVTAAIRSSDPRRILTGLTPEGNQPGRIRPRSPAVLPSAGGARR